METFHFCDLELSEEVVHGIKTAEILRVLRADLEAGDLRAREVSFKDIDACGPPYFYGSRDWWCEVFQGLEPDAVDSKSSEDFVTRFKREFVPTVDS
ncbi:unnamed protein product [Lactuca virosa]|uniref:Sulfotransferase n=1 Tax=Lactuca virosa TaxID=75947 RepID=A0AAU9LAY9_9ASTR|nr:unnamed protein product [Lactuca virosa]